MTLRSLLAATTMVGALYLLPAVAQTTTPSTAPSTTTAPSPTTAPSHVWIDQPNAEWRATKLTGLPVYNNHNEKLGKIEDLLIDDKGQVQAAVIGVGGFLGMGDHLVAIPFDKLTVLFRTQDGKLVTADGQTYTPDQPIPAHPTTTTTTTTTTTGTSTVNGAVDQAGHALADAGRAVGHAAALAGSEAATRVGRFWRDMRGGGPDRAILDASKEALKNAPEFKYPAKS